MEQVWHEVVVIHTVEIGRYTPVLPYDPGAHHLRSVLDREKHHTTMLLMEQIQSTIHTYSVLYSVQLDREVFSDSA